MKNIGKVTMAGLLVVQALGMPLQGSAQEMQNQKPKTTAGKPATTTAAKPLPFNGKVESIDKVAKTLTLSGKAKQTFEITSETKIMKDGKPATFDDAVVGDEMRGSYKKTDDGKLVALSVSLGAKTTTSKPATTTTKKKSADSTGTNTISK